MESCRIIERKVDGDQTVGYLLEQEGLQIVVELRDLYEQEILERLIECGYKYHDYYGDITTDLGISINELVGTPITPDDNLSFKGMFAQQALTEQQALRYFSTNMANIQHIDYREPWKILIHTREELLSYLKRWRNENKSRIASDIYPLNAICAKEALFTPEEIETTEVAREAMLWIANRRRYPNYETVCNLQNFFVEQGLMKEDERGDVNVFIEAYSAWGPEGINAACINKAMEYDVIYNIGVPYTGTGKEKLTFGSVKSVLSADLKDDVLNQINYQISNAVMDKEGNVYSMGNKVSRMDVIEHNGDIMLSVNMMKKYNELRKDNVNWKTPYRSIEVIDILHKNRMVLTLQTESGRLYEWRMDDERIALVNTNMSIFIQITGAIVNIEGQTVLIDRFFGKDGYARYTMFHKLAEEIINTRRMIPKFRSTSEMCINSGLHAEQAMDYIQCMSGKVEASSILHYGFDEMFMRKFGDGIDDLGQDADQIDILEILSNNYNEALDAEGAAKYDYVEVLADILSSNYTAEDKALAIYINNNKPIDKIMAVLDFSNDKIALEQKKGRLSDDNNSNESRVFYCLNTLYKMIYGDVIDQTNIGMFMTSILNNEYLPVSDMVPELHTEAFGCMVDYARLRYKQMKEVNNSVWVAGVVGEYSLAPVEERRHLGFVGLKMNLEKKSRMRSLVNVLMESIDEQMLHSGLYSDSDRSAYGLMLKSNILDFLWGVKLNNIALEESGDYVSKSYVLPTKYKTITINAKLTIGMADYNYIRSNDCPDFGYAMSTISVYCKNSMVATAESLRFDSMLMNVNINPWYIERKKGYEDVPVYNGCLNLINDNQWNTYFKNNLPEVYNSVMNSNGRLAVNPYDYDNTHAIYPINAADSTSAGVLFTAINEQNGRKGSDLPIEFNNYYLESDKDESFRRYMQRITNSDTIVEGKYPGKKLYREPLQSDVYYKNISVYYGIVPVKETEVVDSSYEGKPSKPHAPILTEHRTKILLSGSGLIKVNSIDMADLSVDKLLRCNSLVKNGFAPKRDSYMGISNIYVADEYKTIIDLDTTTIDDMIKLAGQGLCYQITRNEFLFYCVNGTFVLEVD